MVFGRFRLVLSFSHVIFLLIFIPLNVHGQINIEQQNASNSKIITISNDLITLEVFDQPIIDVIKQIGDLADFEVYVIDESIQFPNISASYNGVQVESAIQRLLEEINNVIYFNPGKKHKKHHTISQVWLVGLATNQSISNDHFSHQNNHAKHEYTKVKSLNDAVVEILHDESALSEKEKNRVLTGLINILVTTDDPITKARAAISLGNFKDPRAITTLKQTLTINEPIVRSQAIYALGEIGGDRVTVILGNLLLDANLTLTERIKAAKILKRFKTEKAHYYLELASNNSNKEIRLAVNGNSALKDDVTSTKNHQTSLIIEEHQ